LPSITSVAISARAGVSLQAPEIDTSSTPAGEHDPFRQRELAHSVAGGDALMPARGRIAAQQRDREAPVRSTVRCDPRQDAQRAAGERRLAA
jgi:hypothetical protein